MQQVPENDSDSDKEDITQNFLQELKDQADSSKKNLDVPAWELYVKEHEGDTKPTYTDPNDGTVYEWDEEKRAWFPKVDEDFLATYHASSYQFVEAEEDDNASNSDSETKDKSSKKRKAADDATVAGGKKKAENSKKKPDAWFEVDPDKNTNVYVSGMPDDVTEEEFVEMMGKCGIIMEDGDSGKLKIKLYKDENGKPKGDGRCCYLKVESVQLALDLIDESQMRDKKIKVERAVFQLKGKFNPSLKPKKKKKKKKNKGQEKLLDWVDRDNCRSKNHRIVIFHYMFDHKEFEKTPTAINEVKADLREECEKFGDVRKVLIFDRNPSGVCSVAFREPEMADACIEALNSRWFGGKQITVERWDGITNFQIEETEEEKEKRLKEWEDFLETDS